MFKRRKRAIGKQIKYAPLIQNSCIQNNVHDITMSWDGKL